MSEELKPVRCGCGGEASVDYFIGEPSEGASYVVYCRKCEIQTMSYDTMTEAIQAWNTAVRADRCCNTCDSYEAGRYCLLWSIFCPSDHWCKDWSDNERPD